MRPMSLRLVSGSLLLALGFAMGCNNGPSASNAPTTPPVVTISPSAASSIDQGQTLAMTASVANDVNSAGVLWSLNGSGSLTGTSTTAATYNAPTSGVTAATTVTVSAISLTNGSVSATHSITVNPPLAITTTSLSQGAAGVAYTATLAATGGSGTLTWSLASGTLPSGITLSGAGVISGTVTSNSSQVITVKVTDSSATPVAVTSGNLTLAFGPPLLVLTPPASLANAVQGTVYTSAAFTATGGTGTINWSATGLPAGLALSAATGSSVTITGTPTGSGVSASVVVTATDSGTGSNLQTKSTSALSLTVIPTLTFGSYTATTAIANVTALNIAAPAASGGVTTYSYAATGLPAGLSISAATGAITGTATTATGSPFTVAVTVKDSGTPQQSKTSNLTLTVIPQLSINVPTLVNAVQGTAYTSAAFTATGGTTPITWSATGLPTGLSIGASTGVITGTATGSGASTNVVVTATDSGTGSFQQVKSTSSLTLTVIPTLAITTSTLPGGTVGTAYAGVTLAATGGSGAYTWSATGLPTGLTLNTSTGAISGTPTVTATASSVNIGVTDSGSPQQTKSTSLTITIVAGTPQITIASLPNASTAAAYSQTITYNAEGQAGSPTFAFSSGSLTGSGLSLNAATGVISGSPTTVGGPYSFSITVTVGGVTSAAVSYSISVTSGVAITSSSTWTTATVGTAYTFTLTASGGAGTPYTWSLQSGSTLPPGLSSIPSTGAISFTPTTAGTYNFTVQVADNGSTSTSTQAVTLVINATTPSISTSTLPGATVGTAYSQQIAYNNGGSSATPTFTITSGATSLTSTGLSMSSGGLISGTPTSSGSVSITVTVTVGSLTSTGKVITFTVNPSGFSISGNVSLSSNCGQTNLAGTTVTLSGTSSGTATTDSNGNYSFTGLAAGSYVVTPSFPSATSSVFYPATQAVTISSSNSTFDNFTASLGYTVSGTVNYSGSKTGQVYLLLNNSICTGNSLVQGTSLTLSGSSGAFSIRGVAPGTYTLQAFMDNLGYGVPNASNPSGSTGSVVVSTANLTGANVTLSDPTAPTPTAPTLQGVGGFNNAAIAQFKAPTNSNSVELATSYTLQWSTTSGFTTVAGSQTFPATGPNGTNIWLLNSATNPTITNGSIYYFRAFATVGSTNSANSSVVGPVTIGAPTGGNTVTGSVTFAGTAASGTPLYVGFYDQNTGNFYGQYISSPVSPQTYSVQVPTGSNYFFVAILDNNKNGVLDAGDLSNTSNDKVVTVISGPTTNENLTLPGGNSAATLSTQDFQSTSSGGSSNTYYLNFKLVGVLKLPVSVALTSGNNVLHTMDIGVCTSCGKEFNFQISLNGVAPNVGNGYGLLVTYSDGTSETLTPTVATLLNAFATVLAPTTGSSTSTQPTFTWTDPASASSYVYQFYLSDSSGNTIWQIPGNNSNSNGFSSSVTSIPWITSGNDVIGESGNLPTVTNLSTSTTYSWNITVTDSNGNSTVQQVQYKP